jgi:hypothetical protein
MGLAAKKDSVCGSSGSTPGSPRMLQTRLFQLHLLTPFTFVLLSLPVPVPDSQQARALQIEMSLASAWWFGFHQVGDGVIRSFNIVHKEKVITAFVVIKFE